MSKNFLGIEVTGDIHHGGRDNVPQLGQDALSQLLMPVLENPLFKSVGWQQYTPYFNDGDTCYFSVNSPYFVCVEDETDDDEDEYQYEEDHGVDYGNHPTLGKREYTWNGAAYPNNKRIPGEYTGEHEAEYDLARALNDGIASGAFNDVLLEAFGDHARVRVTRDGITVDQYEHD